MDDWRKEMNYDNDNDDDIRSNDINENSIFPENDDEDEISSENEEKILKVLDNDLVEYFSEAKIIKKKFNNFSKKEKKEKIIFAPEEKVLYKDSVHTILFGPYELDNKVMYELETPNGNVISVKEKYIKKLIKSENIL